MSDLSQKLGLERWSGYLKVAFQDRSSSLAAGSVALGVAVGGLLLDQPAGGIILGTIFAGVATKAVLSGINTYQTHKAAKAIVQHVESVLAKKDLK